MPADVSIFSSLLQKPPSIQDYDAANQAFQRNQLLNALAQNQVQQIPVQNQMLQYQLGAAGIANQKQRALLNLLALDSTQQPMGQAALQGAQGAAQGAPSQGGSDPSMGAAPQNNLIAAAQPGSPPTLNGLSFPKIVAIKALGGPDLTNDYKMLAQGIAQTPGSEVTDVTTGQRRTIPLLDKGQITDANGRTINMPGYVESASAAAGAIASAQEQAKNANTLAPADRINPQTGQPYAATVAGLIQAVNGAPTAPANPAGPAPQIAVSGDPAAFRAKISNSTELSPQDKSAALAAFDQQNPQVTQQIQASLQAKQSAIDAAKQGGPAAMTQFQQTILPHIMAIPDSTQRTAALADFQNDMSTPIGTPVHSMANAAAPQAAPQQSAAPASGFAGFAGPADLAAAKVTAENNANLATKPSLTLADKTAGNVADNDNTYASALNKRVEEGFNFKKRNAEILQQLQDYQTGVGGSDGRTALASNLKNIFPGNQTIAGLANNIAGGSVVSSQTLHQLLAGAFVTNAEQVLDGQGRLTNSISNQLKSAAESASTDPDALKRIMNIQNRFADQDLAEQQARAASIKAGTYNPQTWQADWAAQRNAAMSSPGSVFSPSSPNIAPKAAMPPTQTQAARPIQASVLPGDIAAILKKHGVAGYN